MSEKDEKGSVLSRLVSGGKPKTPQQIASRLLRSGQINDLAAKRIVEDGIVPWRILRYQRVIDPDEFPLPVLPFSHVSIKTFELHLKYIKRNYNPIALGDLASRIYNNEEIPERSIALTFDHGHADFFLNAFALLLKYEIPATICLITGYVDTNTYLPIDRLAFGLSALKHLKKPLPHFKCFDPSVLSNFDKHSDNGQITDKAILLFLSAYNELSEAQRAHLLNSFGEGIQEAVDLPNFEDFLRWEDVQRLAEHGVAFAMMGHRGLNALYCEPDDFAHDVVCCLDRMDHYNIVPEKYYCLPNGDFRGGALDVLLDFKLRVALTFGDLPHPSMQKLPVKLLGRILMSEDNSSSEALLAARIARLVSDGVEF